MLSSKKVKRLKSGLLAGIMLLTMMLPRIPINLNTQVKAQEDILLMGNVLNTNESIIASETGDIIIDSMNVNLSGLVYAPEGNVSINAQNVNMNKIIIIAQTITINAINVNANYNASMAEFIGTEGEQEQDDDFDPDLPLQLYAFGEYLPDDNSIDITWETTVPKGIFDIQISEDNDTYTTIDTVADVSEYNYSITETLDTIYFKISQTTYYGETATSIPFLAVKTDSGYEVELLDTDGDGLADIFENMYGTDIDNPDTDGDSITDGQEVYLTDTDPLVYNSFDENLSDADADCDGDGISNIEEILLGTDPLSVDTDGDGLSDWDEINTYNTDPLNPDTDGDGLLDGDELIIGLDPTDPETYGIPDAEYTLEQSIPTDSDAFSRINTEDSPYKLSMDITAAGYVEGNIVANETPYSKAISNDSMIGIAPALDYEYKDSIESVTLKFELPEDIIDNSISLFPEEEELSGIKRFNIFKYFEEVNMLLPIETQFDIENNLLYAQVDELGTYCVMDMELWMSSFDLPEDILNQSDMSLDMAIASEEAMEFSEEETRITVSETYMNYTEGLMDVTDIEMAINNQLMQIPSTPIDLVFILQTAGVFEDAFNEQREMIKDITYKLFTSYSDVRVCIIEYKENEASIVGVINPVGVMEMWHETSTTLSNAIDGLSYDITYEYCNRGAAFQKMLEDVIFRDTAGKFVYKIMNGLSNVGTGYFSQLDACAQRDIIYSEIMPSELEYADPVYQQMVEDAIAQTNGLSFTFSDTSHEDVYNHITSLVAPPQIEFSAIVPTGWKKVVLDDVLHYSNFADTDGDSLTDWQEVDTDKIDWEADGTILLPTISNCLEFGDKTYAEDGLERFKSDQWVPGMPTSIFEVYLDYILNKTKILPIISDPTDVDTDGDGYTDDVDPRPLIANVNDLLAYNIGKLEELAIEYNDGAIDWLMKYSLSKEKWLVFMFIRQFNQDYIGGFWPAAGGTVDDDFVNYVKNMDEDLYNYFEITTTFNGGNSGEDVDLYHWAAVMCVLIYKSDILDGFKAIIQEYHIDDLGGWAGDLQTLICDMKLDEFDIQDYDGFYSVLKSNIGSDKYSFPMNDLFGDTDACNIYNNLKKRSKSTEETMLHYYEVGYKNRYTSFIDGRSKDSFSKLVHKYTKDKYMKVIRWPIFKKDLVDLKVTDIQSEAARDAFTDYIWDLVDTEG